MEQEFKIDTPVGAMTTFVARPDGAGPFPVAVLYMDAPGYREQLKNLARSYAQSGYYCILPDLFHRFGEGVHFSIEEILGGGPDGPLMKEVLELVGKLTPELGAVDTRAVLDYVAGDDAASDGPKVCVGYCMGARHVLHALSAFPDEFVAGSGAHPGPLRTDAPDSPHHDLATVRGELYFAFADHDVFVTPEAIASFEAEMERAGVHGEVDISPDTEHGFAIDEGPAYDSEQAARHVEKTLDLWRRNLREPVPVS
jgi:carboxymethylenebutenolidase